MMHDIALHGQTRPVEDVIAGEAGGSELLLAAARCWRAARDLHAPVQAQLHAVLAPRNAAMLTPVLDSLLRFYEAALGRRLVVGGASSRSEDEKMLVALMDGSRIRQASIACAAGTGRLLDLAIRATRIMIAR